MATLFLVLIVTGEDDGVGWIWLFPGRLYGIDPPFSTSCSSAFEKSKSLKAGGWVAHPNPG